MTYTSNFDLNGSQLCIEKGSTLTKGNGNWNGAWTVNNYGTFNPNSLNIGNTNTINNHGFFFATSNTNFGTGSKLNNLGTANILGNFSATVVNYGTLNIGLSSVNAIITSTGNLNFTANNVNLNSSSSINSTGNINFSGIGQMDFNGDFSSNGNLTINGNAKFQSDKGAIILGNAAIAGQLENNKMFYLAGSVSAGSIRNNGIIGALNGNQCNSITVINNSNDDFFNDGTITGNNYDYMGTGSALYVNKLPNTANNKFLSGGAKVGSCPSVDCLTTQQITTSVGIDIIYVYKCSDTFVLPQLIEGEELITASIMVVGGGGGGGFGDAAGGGGAGAINYNTAVTLTPGHPYEVVVGFGGAGANSTLIQGENGAISSFNGMIALGGGGGGSTAILNGLGRTGGSGGGGAYSSTGINGIGGQTSGTYVNSGGKANHSGGGNQNSGGGGGGSFGSGQDGSGNSGGNGANGTLVNVGTINILADVPATFYSDNSVSEAFAAGGGGNGVNPGIGNGGGIPSGGGGGSSIGGDGIRGGKGLEGKRNTGSGGGAGSTGGGSGGHGIVIIRVTYRILPVEFLSFNATYLPQDRSALLNWSTAKEWENSHFEIERAVNSVKQWETVGRVEGAGYSEAPVEYNFTDTELPKTGGNIFYRLKQVDFSGKYSYSKTRTIQVDAVDSKTVWVAYPNPSNNGSAISVDLLQLNQYQDELISIRMINMLGEGESAILTSPENMSQMVSEWLLAKKAGLYILEIHWGANIQKIKLIRN
ncbi:glycine-rich domain-containing protein [Algoriphagus sp.]|uniref:glycine-rich domain-containing protein n=1 Tax=Algoriphagus sp. TaxID=1872435 RepID=UPI003F704835